MPTSHWLPPSECCTLPIRAEGASFPPPGHRPEELKSPGKKRLMEAYAVMTP
jgi:hypothetical protein